MENIIKGAEPHVRGEVEVQPGPRGPAPGSVLASLKGVVSGRGPVIFEKQRSRNPRRKAQAEIGAD